jgi:hypothetical protein
MLLCDTAIESFEPGSASTRPTAVTTMAMSTHVRGNLHDAVIP